MFKYIIYKWLDSSWTDHPFHPFPSSFASTTELSCLFLFFISWHVSGSVSAEGFWPFDFDGLADPSQPFDFFRRDGFGTAEASFKDGSIPKFDFLCSLGESIEVFEELLCLDCFAPSEALLRVGESNDESPPVDDLRFDLFFGFSVEFRVCVSWVPVATSNIAKTMLFFIYLFIFPHNIRPH